MKKKPPSREAQNKLPEVNLDMLRSYLCEQNFPVGANSLVIAHVCVLHSHGTDGPFGTATYQNREVSFRMSRFHRIPTAIPNQDTTSPDEGDRIWVLTKITGQGKGIAITWGKVCELPASFMIPSTWSIRAIQFVDRHYRRLRKRIWDSRINRPTHSIV